jgi:hypothetical protein
MATFSFAARNRFVTSSSTCELTGIRFRQQDRHGSVPGAFPVEAPRKEDATFFVREPHQ